MDEEGDGGTGLCTPLQVGLYPALPLCVTKKETASPELAALALAALAPAALAPAAPVLARSVRWRRKIRMLTAIGERWASHQECLENDEAAVCQGVAVAGRSVAAAGRIVAAAGRLMLSEVWLLLAEVWLLLAEVWLLLAKV
jgi:hypothetical protein